MFDWDLVRYFLAVARSGSTLTAATALRESQPTVARRIAALEEALGVTLFDRRRTGYSLTQEGRALLVEAEHVEASALRFWGRANANTRNLSGTIRLTTFDVFANLTLGPALQRFSRLHPDVQVEVLVTDKVLDLASGEADIAIRAGERPATGALVSRKIGETDWTPFCSRAYAEAHGHPTSLEALNGHVLIGGEDNSGGAAGHALADRECSGLARPLPGQRSSEPCGQRQGGAGHQRPAVRLFQPRSRSSPLHYAAASGTAVDSLAGHARTHPKRAAHSRDDELFTGLPVGGSGR
jgi:DNA-binding transcriptional LysR family regulator